MKNPSQKLLEKYGLKEPEEEKITAPAEKENDRRNFLKKSALGGMMLGGFMFSSIEDTLAQSTSKVNRNSAPADLKITDMRYAVVMNGHARCPVIRIDTNQGIYGLGEVRDQGSWRFALFLKSRILGMNPCNVEQIFKRIKQFGFHGRQGGGVCAVEMALWDIAGKAYNVPAYQLLGGKYRDKVRLYADTPQGNNEAEFVARVEKRLKEQGFTFMKMDFGIELLKNVPNTASNSNFWDIGRQWTNEPMSYGAAEHPMTQIQLTDKGLEILANRVALVREKMGYDIPLASDHYGHFDHNNAIRLGKAVEKYRLAWLEDLIPWKFTDHWKIISDAIETPTTTGEDIYLKEDFIKLIDARAIDIVHPDLATSGGLLETKKIGDYAEEKGVAMAMHFAGTPVSFMANVHCAAATQNFMALEHHSVDVDYWIGLVKTKKPFIEKGYAIVPEAPGLGVELNDENVKKHLDPEHSAYFAPTPEWDVDRSWDRLWS
jgi:L-alanine-DL-glutamate epimerase-like enolase superfamily enzyme